MKKIPKQYTKDMLAISLIIISTFFIYNQKKLNNKIAVITKDKNNSISELKYTSGSEIIGTCKNDGENQSFNNEMQEQNVFFYSKINLDLEDKAKPNNIEKIDTETIDDRLIIRFDKPEDNGTNYDYLVKKNNREKTLKFYSSSGIKGYGYTINNSENKYSNVELNKEDNDPIIEENINWDEDYYLHIKTFDKSGNYSENETFKIDLPSEGIEIKYVDLNSNEEIEKSNNIKGINKQEYDVTEEIKQFDDYELINIDGNTKGNLKKDKINITCEYAKKSTLKIRYIDSETEDDLIYPKQIEGYEGKIITINPTKINNYENIDGSIVKEMEPGTKELKIYYKRIPKGKINVKYVDKENNNILEEYSIEDYYNTTYSTDKKEFEEYTFESKTNNTCGVIDKEQIEIVYYYIKNRKEQVKQKLTIKYVDYSNKKVLKTDEIICNESKQKIKLKRIEGYTCMDENDFKKDESLIDELINSLDDDKILYKKSKEGNIIIPKDKNLTVKSEYEIVMNCDNSDYIIYYKK